MIRHTKRLAALLLAGALATGVLAGCGGQESPAPEEPNNPGTEEPNTPDEALTGTIAIDGSSTVYPIAAAMGEEFNKVQPGVRVTIGFSGTGGGFQKFIAGETDISNASRPIKEEERSQLEAENIEFVELKVAIDGLVVVVNKDNDFVDDLTVEELAMMWKPDSPVRTWQDVRPEWPALEIKFFAPGADSGTFDYFTEVITKDSGAIRTDITASEDDNILVNGVAGEQGGIAFFGYAYYEENQDTLKVVAIDNGDGPIIPTEETVMSNTYAPLSRPLFIYVRKDALERPEVKAFVEYYLSMGPSLIPETGYVALPDAEYEAELQKIR